MALGIADFVFDGVAYTRPAGDAVALSWGAAAHTADVAATLDLVASVAAWHGVAGAIAADLELTASAIGEYEQTDRTATVAAFLDLVASVEASHGVAGSAAASLALTGQADAAHGVAGAIGAVLDLAPAAAVAHGVAATIGATLGLVPAIEAVHDRYEVRGEVRIAGVLVNRRVRAYLRTSGALAGETDTTAGRFAIHAGFAPQELYIVPIDLADAATDWAPPVANRVLSVLAQDA